MPEDTDETIYSVYADIHTAWDNDVSCSDIYHMILEWIEVWKPEEVYPEIADLIQDYLERCDNDDSTYDLVEDFIYGSCYNRLCETFMK